MNRYFASVLFFLVLFAAHVRADIVATSFSGTAFAQFRPPVAGVTQTSALSLANLNAGVTADNSISTTTLNWNWTGELLFGTSLLDARKTIPAQQGGRHINNSDFIFNFTLDQTSTISFAGQWGFSNIVQFLSPGENLGLTLTGPSGTVYSDSTTSLTGISSDTFQFLGQIGPGAYEFRIQGALDETINNANTRQGGWQISTFHIAVPEPSIHLAIGVACLCLGTGFRRKGAKPLQAS